MQYYILLKTIWLPMKNDAIAKNCVTRADIEAVTLMRVVMCL